MKKGFTLIELLAVIVILAVIALIAIPIVMGIIEDSRKGAAVASARGYIKAVNYKITQEALGNNIIPIGEYVIGENELEIDAKNIRNITGSYEIGEFGVLTAGLCVNNYSVEYSSGKAYLKEEANYCGKEYAFVEPTGEDLSALCENSNGDSIYSSTDNYKIKTVEDLVCLSTQVNSGKNFNGKEIYLLSNIDITDITSYKDSTITTYGDINGNGTEEGLLIELTTGKGFKPIGTSSNSFNGTFLGYAYTISNLMINRSSEENVGLFGYNRGTIEGLILKDVNITGKNYTGALVGYLNKGTIKSVMVTGIVTGNDYVGGIIGSSPSTSGNTPAEDLVFSGTVIGKSSIAGLMGYNAYVDLKGLVYNSTIRTTSTSQVGICRITAGNNGGTNSGRTSNVTLEYSSRYCYGSDGDNFRTEDSGMLVYDDVLDTIVGGDDNDDKYYYDYDANGNLTLYSTERKPIQNKLKGEGTSDKPYLIRNANDWRLASTTVTDNKYYSVTGDIDFTGKNYYPLGTNTNKFNGNINGNMHTISNIAVGGYKNVGLIAYNLGTIEGFKFNNITVSASNENVGLIGYNDHGTIKGIEANNVTVTGTNYIGGLVGYYNKGEIRSIIIRGNITGNNYVGGVIGSAPSSSGNVPAESLIFSGTVTGNNRLAGLMAYNAYADLKGYVYNTTITSTITSTTTDTYIRKITSGSNGGNTNGRSSNVNLVYAKQASGGSDGGSVNEAGMLVYDDVLDTIVGGDNDEDHYYIDFDSNNNLTIYSTILNPIKNTLAGEGTQSKPYLIKNTDDWRIASTLGNKSKYFSVTSDIDFTGKNYYPLGTNTNKFNGNINGNMHTLSNITVGGYANVGLIGYNLGTIEGFKLNNITVSGSNENVGLIGYNDYGTIKGIEANNVTVTGTNNVAGVVGYYKKGTIRNVMVKGSITGNNYVGGISGFAPSTSGDATIESVVFSGTVTGNDRLAGLMAYNAFTNLKGFVYDSTITTTSTSTTSDRYIRKITSGTNGGSTTGKVYNVNLVYAKQASGGKDGTAISEITISNLSDVLDTVNNSTDGYYFDINNGSLVLLHSN